MSKTHKLVTLIVLLLCSITYSQYSIPVLEVYPEGDVSANRIMDENTLFSGNHANGQLSLVNPFGGEYFLIGTDTQIKWDTSFEGKIEIKFSSDGGDNWSIVQSNADAHLGSLDWTVPDISSTHCKIKISPVPDDGTTNTSYNFTIGDKATLPRILVDEEFEDWDIFSKCNNGYMINSFYNIQIFR